MSEIVKTRIVCVCYCISCTTWNGIILCTNILINISYHILKEFWKSIEYVLLWMDHDKANPNNFNSSSTLIVKQRHFLYLLHIQNLLQYYYLYLLIYLILQFSTSKILLCCNDISLTYCSNILFIIHMLMFVSIIYIQSDFKLTFQSNSGLL